MGIRPYLLTAGQANWLICFISQPFWYDRHLKINNHEEGMAMFGKTRFSLVTLAAVFLSFWTLSASAMGINKSITVDANETAKGQSTVNGSITIGENAKISGSLETVNGSIRIASGAQADDVDTVNGSIRIGSSVSVADVQTVNGSITIDSKSVVSGGVETVNGRIELDQGVTVADNVETVNGELNFIGATVSGSASTVNGDVTLQDQAVIKGDLTIEKPTSSFWRSKDSKRKLPVVTIGPGSRVDGTIILERKVKLFISDTATVGGISGVMTMEDAVRFSGKRP